VTVHKVPAAQAICNLPDVPVIIGVYGFAQPDAIGDEYVVYGELETPISPTLGDEQPEPVVVEVDFDNPEVRTVE
jgi:hypothetical protein